MLLPVSTIRSCVFPFPSHERHNHDWHFPATFDYQIVRISISWAAKSWLTCSPHFRLRGCAIISFLALYHDGWSWYVHVIFNSRAVRNSISFATPSRLTSSCHFRLMQDTSAWLRNSISFLEQPTSRLTCSRHYRLTQDTFASQVNTRYLQRLDK